MYRDVKHFYIVIRPVFEDEALSWSSWRGPTGRRIPVIEPW